MSIRLHLLEELLDIIPEPGLVSLESLVSFTELLIELTRQLGKLILSATNFLKHSVSGHLLLLLGFIKLLLGFSVLILLGGLNLQH
jgi:hypothetical protein